MEVYYTNALILLVKIMLCSKFHSIFYLKPFFCKITLVLSLHCNPDVGQCPEVEGVRI